MNGFDLLARVRQHSPWLADKLTERLMPRLIPLAGILRVEVDELTDTRCVLAMPLFRRSRNHLRSMYFGAQMTLADLTVGLLLFQRFPPGPFGGVIRKVEAEFHAKAKSRLTCTAELTDDVAATLDEARHNESGKAEAWLPLELLDTEGTRTTSVRFLVAIKRFEREK